MIDVLSMLFPLVQASAETAASAVDAQDLWISEETAIYLGAYGGAGLGVLGGILGGIGGPMAQKGKGKGPILASFTTVAVLGVLLLVTGVVALVAGQPYVIYYPFLLLGLIASAVFGGLIPVMRKHYRMAEQRKMEAEALRRA